jgi:hypothetical protein
VVAAARTATPSYVPEPDAAPRPALPGVTQPPLSRYDDDHDDSSLWTVTLPPPNPLDTPTERPPAAIPPTIGS